jgi:predicted transcriptional regulator
MESMQSNIDDAAMAALIGVLEQLWRITTATPDKPCSLAKLSKQSQRQMSVLKRQLTFLDGVGWVELDSREDGSGSVRLSAAGHQVCEELFAA